MTHLARDWKNDILSQGQGDLFDRWIEFLGALVLAVATVATAWSAYQAALWSGDEAKFYFEATSAQMEAHQNHGSYMQRSSVQADLFVEYVAALSMGNQKMADFLYQRFPVELQTAMDAWLATDPWTSPEAPKTPFVMAEYRLPEQEAAQQQLQLAQERFAAAADADEDADRYVLLTVIFASSLFFSGIAGKFQWRIIDGVVLAMGMIVLTVGLVMLTQLPVQ